MIKISFDWFLCLFVCLFCGGEGGKNVISWLPEIQLGFERHV